MVVKAFLTRKDKPLFIVPCMFNPEQLTVEKSNEFKEMDIPGLPSPVFQFVKGNARSLTLDLFFDTYELGLDVRVFTDRITGWDAGSIFSKLPTFAKGLMDIDSDLHAPPVCLFIWGAYIFECIITSTTKKFTMFLPIGIPVRATVSVTMKEYRELESMTKELDLHSADITKSHVVNEGDSLWAIAAKEYGDPKLWRKIADANDIDNPRLLEPGAELIIPVNTKES
jgi:nucleoid-associated protein YgaU